MDVSWSAYSHIVSLSYDFPGLNNLIASIAILY